MLPLFGALSTWLTPFWLLAAGVLAGMVVLGLAYGVIRLASRRLTLTIHSSFREGFLLPVLVLGGILSVYAVAVAFVVPFESFVRSVARLAAATTVEQEVEVAADAKELEVDLGVVPAEVSEFEIEANQNMYFTVEL